MKQINKKKLITRLMIAVLTVAMFGVFIMQASASNEYEWTSNSSLIKDEGKWDFAFL